MSADDLLLILDTHAVSRRRLAETVSRAGYTALEVASPTAALALWEDQGRPPVLVALRGTAVESLKTLAERRATRPDLMLVAVGVRSADAVLAAWRAGADGYLPRPVRGQDLSDALEQAAAARGARAERRAREQELLAQLAREADPVALSDRVAVTSIRQLAAELAHEINNPLTPILGMAELLLEDLPAGHIGRDYAQSIAEAALRIRDVVQRLADMGQQG